MLRINITSMDQVCKYAVRKHAGVQLKRQVICKNVYMLPSQKNLKKDGNMEEKKKKKKRNSIDLSIVFILQLIFFFFQCCQLLTPSPRAR